MCLNEVIGASCNPEPAVRQWFFIDVDQLIRPISNFASCAVNQYLEASWLLLQHQCELFFFLVCFYLWDEMPVLLEFLPRYLPQTCSISYAPSGSDSVKCFQACFQIPPRMKSAWHRNLGSTAQLTRNTARRGYDGSLALQILSVWTRSYASFSEAMHHSTVQKELSVLWGFRPERVKFFWQRSYSLCGVRISVVED